MMMLEEGLSLPLELAKLRVARAFNVVVQMYGDSIAGIKKLIVLQKFMSMIITKFTIYLLSNGSRQAMNTWEKAGGYLRTARAKN